MMNHVVIVDPSPAGSRYGGSTISLLEMLNCRPKEMNDVRFTILFKYHNELVEEFSSLPNVYAEYLFTDVPEENSSRLGRVWQKLAVYDRFNRWLNQAGKTDLIVVNSRIGSGRFAILIGWFRRIPVICHERLWTVMNPLNRWIGNRCERIIANSDYIREWLITGGIHATRVTRIYNGIHIPDSPQVPRAKNDPMKIILVGNIMPWKGQDLFADSYSYLKTKNVQYFLAGGIHDQVYFSGLQERFSDHFQYLGFVPNVTTVLDQYDLLVHASQKPEPFGRTIIEAMSKGVPVVGTNIGGPAETIKDLQTGLLFQYDSPRDLAEKIDMVLGDDSLREKIVIQAFENIQNHFNILELSQQVFTEYNNCITRGR